MPRSRKKSLRAFKEEQHVWIRNSRDNRDCLLDSLAGKKGMKKDRPIGAPPSSHLRSLTPTGKRMSVVIGPNGRTNAFVYRTTGERGSENAFSA